MSVFKILTALTLTFILQSCATITSGKYDVLEINTSPSGAQVQTSNGLSCLTTPCSLKMARRSDFLVTITKEGYKTTSVNVTNKIGKQGGAGLAGNVLVGGGIGILVDSATGAARELTPNPINVTLEQK